MDYFRFFLTRTKHFTAVNPNTLGIKNLQKNLLNYYSLKVKNFKVIVLWQKTKRGEVA